ncbi:hypothetical protein C1H46_022326 [Malus baccata]|uniref:Uncharacterized protein n=1 Tax=Malus baccata TaxID=106549 RepID=A0A540M027_MALBA|nr:hypothetical protein C1H46_022326 [Malus baccata]
MVASRCLCCGKALRPSGSRSWAIMQFITSWANESPAAYSRDTGVRMQNL